MAQLTVVGEEFLRAIQGAVGDELRESRGPYEIVTNQDIDWYMDQTAQWLVKQYFRSRNEVPEDKD
jgi:hypothetical protein